MAGVELPDWMRGTVLLGKFGDDYIAIAIDASGQMYVVAVGADAGGTPRTLRVDASGQLIMVPRGASGNYMNVDAAGFLTTVMKGVHSGELKTITTDSDGSMLARLIATCAGETITVAADASGQLIMVPRGASGNYMNVDASGFLTTVMKGLEGSTLHTIAVDASGNIIGVLKGGYGSELKTIQVDSEGRLFAYLQDREDHWGAPLSGGLSELSARLGSLQTYERRGQVIGIADFSCGRGTVMLEPGLGADAYLSPIYHMGKGYSAFLTAGINAGQACAAALRMNPVPVGKTIGVAAWIKFDNYPSETRLTGQSYDGSVGHQFGAKFNYPEGTVGLYNSSGSWTNIGTWDIDALNLWGFRIFKVVVNTATGKYVRILCDNQSIDVSAYSYKQSAYSLHYLNAVVQIVSDGTNYGPIYLGGIIVTDMEL